MAKSFGVKKGQILTDDGFGGVTIITPHTSIRGAWNKAQSKGTVKYPSYIKNPFDKKNKGAK